MTSTIQIFSLKEVSEFKHLFLIIHIMITRIVWRVFFLSFACQQVNKIVFHFVFLFYSRKKKKKIRWKKEMVWVSKMNKNLDFSADLPFSLLVDLVCQPYFPNSWCDLLKVGDGRRDSWRAEKSHTSQFQDMTWNEALSPGFAFLQVTGPRAIATRKIKFTSGAM